MLTALERAFHLAKSGRVKERDDRRLGMARLIAENASGKRGGRDKWAGVGLATVALAGAAVADPYYYGGGPGYCGPYYGCGAYAPAYGYRPSYGYSRGGNSGGGNFSQVSGYALSYGYSQGGNSGGANFPQ